MHYQRIISASSAHHQRIISASSSHHQCIISASSVHYQCIISASSAYHQCIIRPDQTREDFNLADLIIELAFLLITLQHARLAMGGSQMGSPSSIMTSHLPPTQNPHPKPTISPEQPTNKCCATWHNPGCLCNSGGPAGIGRGVFPCYTASHNLKRSSFFRFFIFFRLRCAECLFRTDYLLLGK